uniref:Urotensin-related peptide 1 n=1 Tax=Sinocyclocheilus rhinocerous TaxID=307959 RepID=A0A673LST9_9TELE
PLNMLSLALLYILAVVCSVWRTHALPLYSDTEQPQQEGKISSVLLISWQPNHVFFFTFLLGAKETLQQGKINNMVDDLKAVVLKLAAADNLRSQGYLRSEQNLPKNNKRGDKLCVVCFWLQL